jgi:hypothetical protein
MIIFLKWNLNYKPKFALEARWKQCQNRSWKIILTPVRFPLSNNDLRYWSEILTGLWRRSLVTWASQVQQEHLFRHYFYNLTPKECWNFCWGQLFLKLQCKNWLVKLTLTCHKEMLFRYQSTNKNLGKILF